MIESSAKIIQQLVNAVELALTFRRGGCPDKECRVCKTHQKERRRLEKAIAAGKKLLS
jgi:hypothetical protein